MSSVVTAVVIGAAFTGYSIYASEKSMQAQREAQIEARGAAYNAEQAAKLQDKKNEEAMNAQNRKKPDIGAILSAAQQASKQGGGSTMLTGPMGVDPSTLSLGRNTLLGS